MMTLLPSDDALVAHLEGEAVLLHAGTKEYFRLNETGQVVWRMLEAAAGPDAIAARLASTYQVSADLARAEVDRLIAELTAGGLVTHAS